MVEVMDLAFAKRCVIRRWGDLPEPRCYGIPVSSFSKSEVIAILAGQFACEEVRRVNEREPFGRVCEDQT